MREQEVRSFCRALQCDAAQIRAVNLLDGSDDRPNVTQADIDAADIVLFGGSGDYSVAQGGPWMPAAMGVMRRLVELGKPTFASCWGFQAMARALGGQVVTDLSHAELGTLPVTLTDAGRHDPVFGAVADDAASPPSFTVVMGHKDYVAELPPGVTLLASTPRVPNQAFRVDGKPIYCTQFHPELDGQALIDRLRAYPSYVQEIANTSAEAFFAGCRPTPEANRILRLFVEYALA